MSVMLSVATLLAILDGQCVAEFRLLLRRHTHIDLIINSRNFPILSRWNIARCGTYHGHRWAPTQVRPIQTKATTRSDAIIVIPKSTTSKIRKERKMQRKLRQLRLRHLHFHRSDPRIRQLLRHALIATAIHQNEGRSRLKARLIANKAFTWVGNILNVTARQLSLFSLQSASSLLLTVANLENFAKIHEQSRHHHLYHPSALDNVSKIQNQASSIINIHPNNFLSPPHHLKTTKELDQLSTASSTHFTMVNGFGRENAKRKSSYICKRSQQVSILIITMSVLFLIGISTAVILLESKWFGDLLKGGFVACMRHMLPKLNNFRVI